MYATNDSPLHRHTVAHQVFAAWRMMLCQAYVVSWQSFMHLRLCVHSPVFCSAQSSDCRMHCSFGSLQKCCCRSAPMVRVELQNSVRGTDRSRNRCQVSSLTYSLTQSFYRLLQYCESLPGLSSIHLQQKVCIAQTCGTLVGHIHWSQHLAFGL